MQLQVTGHIVGIEARNGGWFAVAIQEQGAQYPKKLSTKRAELIQMAQQMIGQYVDALYNESESTNINPNNGQPYMNRFLEALAMAGSMPQQQQPQQQQPVAQFPPNVQPQQFQGQPQGFAGQPAAQPFVQQQPVMQQQPQQGPVITPQQKEERIMREAAAKVAVDLLDHLDQTDRNLASLIRISEQLVQYFRDGVPWQAPPVTQPPPPAQQQHQQGQPGGGSEYNPGYAAQQPQMQQQQDAPPSGWPAPADDDIPF